MPRHGKVPECLRDYARRGLLDKYVRGREPLPDEVPSLPVWGLAWQTREREEAAFRHTRRHSHMDEADGDSDA